MNARPRLNKAYIMIVIAALLMLAAMVGGVTLRKRWRAESRRGEPPAKAFPRP